MDLLKCCSKLVRILTRLIFLEIIVFQQPSTFLIFLLTMKIKKTKWTCSSRGVLHRSASRSSEPNLMSVQAYKFSLKTKITTHYFKTFFLLLIKSICLYLVYSRMNQTLCFFLLSRQVIYCVSKFLRVISNFGQIK